MDTIAAAELDARLRAAFGPRWRAWAYQCPACGEVATGEQMVAAIDPHRVRADALRAAFDTLGQECIGRGRPWVGRGCDARAVTHSTVLVEHPDGTTCAVFALARPQTHPLDAPPEQGACAPGDRVADAPAGAAANAAADAPPRGPARTGQGVPARAGANPYALTADARSNRKAKAEKLAKAMTAAGLGPERLPLDKATSLRIRKAAFGHAKSVSVDTWREVARVLTEGADAVTAPG